VSVNRHASQERAKQQYIPVESDPTEREELMLQADMLNGINPAKFA